MSTQQLEPFCFWCGGNARFDFHTEARPFYEDKHKLCNTCIGLRRYGIIVFELTETDPGCGNPVHSNGYGYYTGRWTTVEIDEITKLLGPKDVKQVIDAGVAILRDDQYTQAKLDIYPWRTIQ